MSTITVSPKYQIVIPKDIRDRLNLKPGQKIQAIVYEGRIELIPVKTARELRGFAKGMCTDLKRDPDRL